MEQKSTPYRTSSVNRSQLLARDISESLGKLPPQAPDLEESILGALMLEKYALTRVIEFLRPDHFYSEQHKEIYQAIENLFKANEPVDMRTVVAQLRKDGKIEIVGGAYYIAELTSKVASAANIEYHARIIVEHAIKRNLIQFASKMHQLCYEDTENVFEILDSFQATFDEIYSKNIRGSFATGLKLYNDGIKLVEERQAHKGLIGVPSMLIALDEITNGFQKSELTIIAARPGMGKTALAIGIMKNVAIDLKIPIAFFSLEMANTEITDRMFSAEGEIDLQNIRGGKLSDWDSRTLPDRTAALKEAKIFVDDSPSLSIIELRAKAKRLKSQEGVEMIIVDYLQLMHDPNENNREQEIASISRGLKILAKELKVPVIALSQLSRGVESRGGSKRPMLSDLRESGSIEQDADVVMFLYRPEYYSIKTYEDGASTANIMEVIVAKHRNGSLGTAMVKFVGKFTKVANIGEAENKAPEEKKPATNPDDLPF